MAVTINGKEYADGTKQMYNLKTKTYDILAPGADTTGYTENNQNTFIDPKVNAIVHANPNNYNATQEGLYNYNGSGNLDPSSGYTGTMKPISQPQAQPQTTSQLNIQAEMEKLKAAQLASVTAGLDKAKAGALSNLSADRAKIQPTAIADRNKANIGMNNVNRAWSELMASKFGQSQSGSANLGYGLNQAQYLGNVGTINRNATNAELENDRRVTDVNNNYLSDLEAARAGVETNYLNRMIDQMNTDRNFNYQVGRDSVNDSRYNQEYTDNRSDINYDRNYQNSRDAVLDKRYTDETSYKKEQDRLDNEFRNNQFDFTKEQAQLDREWQSGQFDYQKARDLVSDSRYATEWKQKLDEWAFNKSQTQWSMQLNQNQFNYQKERDKLAQQNYDKEWLQKMDEWAWSKSEKNPQVKGQILSNKIAELEAAALPEMQKQQLIQIKKQIAQIGAAKPISDYERDMQEIELETAKKKLDLLSAPDEKAVMASKINAITSDLSKMLPRSAYAELNNHPDDYISDIGPDEYSKLLALYKKRAEMGE